MIEKFDDLPALEKAIANAYERLKAFDADTDGYSNIVDQLVKLTKIRALMTDTNQKWFDTETRRNETLKALALKEIELQHKVVDMNKPDRLSKDTLALVLANIAGILIIVGYERVNVIASKAIGFIMRR